MTNELFGYLQKKRVFTSELTVIESDKYAITDITSEEYGDDYPDRYCVKISIPITSIKDSFYDAILYEYLDELTSKIKEAYARIGLDYAKNQLDILTIDEEWSVNAGTTSKKIYFR
jgi:hypothetical protein